MVLINHSSLVQKITTQIAANIHSPINKLLKETHQHKTAAQPDLDTQQVSKAPCKNAQDSTGIKSSQCRHCLSKTLKSTKLICNIDDTFSKFP